MNMPHGRHWLTMCLVLAVFSGPSEAAPGDVTRTLESPCRYPSALTGDGTHLLLADWRDARLYRIDPADGEVLRTWDAPTLKPHALAFADGLLFVGDDHTGTIYAWNPETGVVANTFQAPADNAAGLAFARDTLFVLASGKIYQVLPEDGTILNAFDVPHRGCRCLAYDGRHLWVSNRLEDELYMVDPATGKVLGIVKSPGPYPAGLAWLDGQLWNVDFQTRQLNRIRIHDNPMYTLSDTRRARVEYLWGLNNYGPGTVSELTLHVAIPTNLPNQKLISEPVFSRIPDRTDRDRWGQPCAVFTFGTVPPQTKANLSYVVETEVSAIRYLIIPERTGALADIPPDIRQAYTADGSHYRIHSPYIQETVKKVVGSEANPYWIARKIYDFVIESLEYEMVGGWDVPERVLKRGSGSCSEYTYAFVTLCRAAGLPARYQGSVVVRGDDASIDKAFHRWAQVYLPNYGWIPVDANRGDSPSPVGQARGIGGLSNRFLITTQGGGDSEYLRWGYNSFARYRANGYCKVEEDHFGFWEPLAGATPATAASTATDSDGCRQPPPD